MSPSQWALLAAVLLALAALIAVRRLLARRPARSTRRVGPGIPGAVERRYTRHARERMQQRGVSRDQVEATLAAPDRTTYDPEEHSQRLERLAGGVLVKVWVAAEPWPPVREVVIKSTALRHVDHRRIPKRSVPHLIGRRGSTITAIRRQSGAQVHVADDGTVEVSADDRAGVELAWRLIDRALAS